jgi:predicted ATPase
MAVARIAVTGGPGAGKTTIWRALSSLHPDQVVGVAEVATALFQRVFPAVRDAEERRLVQHAIFAVQRDLEDVHAARVAGHQVLLCDRGTPDGAGYWPDGIDAFFAAMGARWEDELARYDAVLFLETAAAGGLSIAEGNSVRTEALDAAVVIDRRLYDVWAKHPRIRVVPHQPDFERKVELGTEILRTWLAR